MTTFTLCALAHLQSRPNIGWCREVDFAWKSRFDAWRSAKAQAYPFAPSLYKSRTSRLRSPRHLSEDTLSCHGLCGAPAFEKLFQAESMPCLFLKFTYYFVVADDRRQLIGRRGTVPTRPKRIRGAPYISAPDLPSLLLLHYTFALDHVRRTNTIVRGRIPPPVFYARKHYQEENKPARANCLSPSQTRFSGERFIADDVPHFKPDVTV